jgi:hypothetical protein
VETSGAADPSSLAAQLSGGGFALDLVAAVVDAEDGGALLAREELARAQVGGRGARGWLARGRRCARACAPEARGPRASGAAALAPPPTSHPPPLNKSQVQAADLVVLNKVDLATLGAVCDLEDTVRSLAPGARTLRCRFGGVPPEAVVDVAVAAGGGAEGAEGAEEEEKGGGGAAAAGDGGAGGAAGGGKGGSVATSVVGEVGFLSHEGPAPSAPRGPGGGAAGAPRRAPGWRRRAGGSDAAAAAAAGGGAGGAAGIIGPRPTRMAPAGAPGAAQHRGFATVSVMEEGAPLCMACFGAWVTGRLLASPGEGAAGGLGAPHPLPGPTWC